ncbi:hypothetical protein [Micromonospora sp. NPDC048830]|uniref:hypothetical protein n=1 Tax=Micromonospora sp. NPDC048830 TaxID=3364257 RepID=UPI00371B90BF
MSYNADSKIKDPSQFYVSGPTTVFASQSDQRFSYLMYIPKRIATDPDKYPLVVIQHGTGRTAGQYRDLMASFCEKERVVVLAPLFPAGIDDPDDLHNYKFIEYRGLRFDTLLLDMIDEAAQRVPIDTSRFMLHGFSGGGQFAHRFLYLHPDRLMAVSVGAPGRLTLLDDTSDWWLGTRNVRELFGVDIDLPAIRGVPVQLVIGELDIETWETNDRSGSNWLDGLEKQGNNRRERMETFRGNLRQNGIDPRVDIVPGVAHDGRAVLPVVREFFADVLAQSRSTPAS